MQPPRSVGRLRLSLLGEAFSGRRDSPGPHLARSQSTRTDGRCRGRWAFATPETTTRRPRVRGHAAPRTGAQTRTCTPLCASLLPSSFLPFGAGAREKLIGMHTPPRPRRNGHGEREYLGGRERRARPTTMLFAARAVMCQCVLAALVGTAAAQNSTTEATPASLPAAKDYQCTKCLGRPIRASPLPPTACFPCAAGARALTRTRGDETLSHGVWCSVHAKTKRHGEPCCGRRGPGRCKL